MVKTVIQSSGWIISEFKLKVNSYRVPPGVMKKYCGKLSFLIRSLFTVLITNETILRKIDQEFTDRQVKGQARLKMGKVKLTDTRKCPPNRSLKFKQTVNTGLSN